MSQLLLVGTYRPGHTVLHRLPVGPKVAALAAFSLAVVLVRSLPASAVCLALAVTAALVGHVALGSVLRALRGLAVLLVVISAVQWWVNGLPRAVETTLDLVGLAVAALVLTSTTPVNAVLDAIVRWLRPLRRLGVDPERVALAFSLAIAALPATLALALETRDAARARGLGRHPRAYLTPFVVRVVARAHETGDALHARGLGD
ncbi:energy-coupling factor transporter transmembrane component T family protein [Nocardioides marmotae]|uniref:energy-coupling factor transporter transmembrane component T family protein n=1 Tax=Nocardioides marmotae TaxID=2663857 RepID=UPI001322D446|nr:energy-coupling factor transporter transmembrane protein EcfT [Nocardioides marmotae]MBC9735044.1 energy-coupling factor transporter transmembrane protein EcfT [Nocardioides marmotae]MTB86144.1 energy-coupling factor transporter transmembrane protein EcfT [Nocardioides marmotae]